MVTEAASANVWIVDAAGRLRTRDLSQAILGGVTRAAVLELPDLDAKEGPIPLADLEGAKEVFLSSSGGMILPVVAIDDRGVGDGVPGPVTLRVQQAYWDRIGLVP